MELSGEGIEVVAVSNDRVEDLVRHKRRDGLSFELLSDSRMRAIDRLGLRHEKGLPFTTFTVLGIPLGFPRRPRPMAVPTTFLVDEEGIVQWIDQAEDYRIRGDEQRVRDAITGVWG